MCDSQSVETFISRAIKRGAAEDLAELSALERGVFLISEAEVLGDMEGVESFLEAYAPGEIQEAANAFEAVGAQETAELLRSAARAVLSTGECKRLNELITSRAGYDYEALARWVRSSLQWA